MSALMVNNLAAAGLTSLSAFDASSRIELRPDLLDVRMNCNGIPPAYRQVLGNDYIMKSERLTSPSLCCGKEALMRSLSVPYCQVRITKNKFLSKFKSMLLLNSGFKHLLGRPTMKP